LICINPACCGSTHHLVVKENTMPRILIPLDGSPASDRAVKHVASGLKDGGEAEVHLLHVQPALVPQNVPEVARPGLTSRLAAEDEHHAFDAARRELERAGVRYTTHVVSGEPAQEIAFYTNVLGCEGIVMGTRGFGAIKSLMLGSVAMKVLHLVNVPVTLVK
jgi:nucleotide-binding universal stress UspA family protein